HGKTGGWLSDLFGTTNPESRRLREMLKEEGAIPPGCIGTRTEISPEELTAWQTRVINYTGLGHREALHAVLSRKILTPPLRDDLNHLRFSPDGNYLLAQDDASIYVLSREPFESLFRIDAPDAYPAEFSPDSQSIVFYTPNLRVETWNVADGTRTAAHEVAVLRRCLQTALSPDGKFLACFDSRLTLALFDVMAGTPVFEKKQFHELTFNEYLQFLFAQLLSIQNFKFITMRFSPDARYFLAARLTDDVALALPSCTKLPLPSGVRNFLQIEFTFLGPDRLAGVGWGRGDKSGVVKFPGGELLNTITLGSQELTGAEHGDYLMLKPIQDHPLGVLDIRTNKIVGVNEKTAQDIYDSTMATESISGRVGLYALDTNKPLAFADLPIGPLGNLRAASVSKSLTWLAVSGTSRGAIWDLSKGQRVFNLRGFRGAYFGDDGSVYADFPKFKSAKRSIGRMDLLTTQASGGPALDESSSVIQRGPFLISLKPEKSGAFGDKENPTLEVRDVRTGASLWIRAMRGASPRIWADVPEGTLVLGWPLSSPEAREEIKKDAAVAQRVAPVKSSDENYFLQVVNAQDGHVLGSIAVDTSKGAFRLNRAIAAGDRIVAFDSANRVLVYSLLAGTEAGRLFGGNAVATSATSLLAVENEPGKLAIYDLKTLAKRDDFVFSSRVAMMQFNEVGTKLFVLTAAQEAYVLDMSTSLRPPAKTEN
ncbi:MAG: WD40 repeat domain-containing protein, partial [Candidatus Acidiferrales bacterium]